MTFQYIRSDTTDGVLALTMKYRRAKINEHLRGLVKSIVAEV